MSKYFVSAGENTENLGRDTTKVTYASQLFLDSRYFWTYSCYHIFYKRCCVLTDSPTTFTGASAENQVGKRKINFNLKTRSYFIYQ